MRITKCYRKQAHVVSFEFFPPKSAAGEAELYQTIAALKHLAPGFVSMTYGAAGSTREKTVRLTSHIKNKIGIEAMAHLTCLEQSRAEITAILSALKQQNIENIIALRGDPRPQEAAAQPPPDGFRYGAELVAFIRENPEFRDAFDLAVAGYPEGHSEQRDKNKDLEYLKRKVDAGADVIITQLFFDNADYFAFCERVRKIGISVPIVPGIMPITHAAQLPRFVAMCGAKIPPAMDAAISGKNATADSIRAYGIDYATTQCAELLANGAPGLHFYTLNKSKATMEIYSRLNIETPPCRCKAAAKV